MTLPLIILDAGHGGPDPGACGGPMREAGITLDLVRHVAACLHGHDVAVEFTRTANRFLSLGRRVQIEHLLVGAHAGDACFVSVHCNSTGPHARGHAVFYCDGSARGRNLAGFVQRAIHDAVPEMPIYCGDGIIADLPFYGHSLTVLKHTISPAALVEFGFISNLADRALLADDDILARAAQGIATGILAWVFAGSGGGGA